MEQRAGTSPIEEEHKPCFLFLSKKPLSRPHNHVIFSHICTMPASFCRHPCSTWHSNQVRPAWLPLLDSKKRGGGKEKERDSLVSIKLLFICQFLHVRISEKTNNLQRLLDVICLLAEILSASPVVLRSSEGSFPPSSFFTPKQHADTLPTELT